MIDPKKIYRTLDGREARVYAVDGRDDEVHGAVKMVGGWVLCSWNYVGRCNNLAFGDFFNLIEVKPRIKREVWVNVYPDGVSMPFLTKEAANNYTPMAGRIACVKIVIDCEEGTGL